MLLEKDIKNKTKQQRIYNLTVHQETTETSVPKCEGFDLHAIEKSIKIL